MRTDGAEAAYVLVLALLGAPGVVVAIWWIWALINPDNWRSSDYRDDWSYEPSPRERTVANVARDARVRARQLDDDARRVAEEMRRVAQRARRRG